MREWPVLLFQPGDHPSDVEPEVAGDDVGSQFAEHVVVRGGAGVSLGAESQEHSSLGELEEPFSRLTGSGEVKLGELMNGEDVMTAKIDADVSVPRRHPPRGVEDFQRRYA